MRIRFFAVACVLVGLTGCAWLRPPVESGRGAIGPGEKEYREQAWPSLGQESREHLPSRDYNRWVDSVRRASP
jgi:hypothetical protein